MLKNLQRLGRGQRIVVFFLFFGGGLMLLCTVTVLLAGTALNSERSQGSGLIDGVTVSEFVALPDDDAYPPAVTVGADGTVYTGSYVTGAVWAVTPDGTVSEIDETRDRIGAVAGLAVGGDGAVYVVDQQDSDPRSAGGDVKRIAPDGTVTAFAEIAETPGFIAPDDITLDGAGRVYVSDRGRNEIWRFEQDGSGGVAWWTPPTDDEAESAVSAVTGLAYDAASDALIVTDSETNRVYRVSVADASAEVLYEHTTDNLLPGFDGVTITDAGVIYVAALGQNGIVRLDNGEITYVAGYFRGVSDAAAAGSRLYVTNFDQSSLVLPLVEPRLPFALDVVELE